MAKTNPSDLWRHLGKSLPSLDKGGKKVYLGVHVRHVSDQLLRIQTITANEYHCKVSKAFAGWVDRCNHPAKSTAGTGVRYATGRIRTDGLGYVRLQMEGPQLNRTWGACVKIKSIPLYWGVAGEAPPEMKVVSWDASAYKKLKEKVLVLDHGEPWDGDPKTLKRGVVVKVNCGTPHLGVITKVMKDYNGYDETWYVIPGSSPTEHPKECLGVPSKEDCPF